jgi:phospholipase/carboxylesterase
MSSPSYVHVFQKGLPQGPTLVLLHGTGGDENNLIPLAKSLLPEANLLGLRGKVLENGAPRFFRRFEEGVLDIEDWRTRSAEVADFIQAAALEYGFDLRNTYALGYSNGANLATGILLLHSDALAGAVLLRPMFVAEVATKSNLAGKSVLINYGGHDPFLGDGDIVCLQNQFTLAGAEVTVHEENTGHGLGPGDLPVVKAWLENRETT